jgi:hypothetical protein
MRTAPSKSPGGGSALLAFELLEPKANALRQVEETAYLDLHP